jgi:S-adenosyl-L-methionine hydrolase (adenosine-forming)
MARALVTLTTDFGIGSPYVAQMKGALLAICRDADIVDVTHAIAPQNIREGAIVLGDVTPRFPPGTLHVVVVDPGVGTSRRLVYAEIVGQRYLSPDNGLLSWLLKHHALGRAFALENRQLWSETVSFTFHGRDVLAPVAAHLCRGVSPDDLGPPIVDLATIRWPEANVHPDRLAGEVLYVDSFGNLITNIDAALLDRLGARSERIVECSGARISGVQATYGLSRTGEVVALVDSQGRLEVAVVNGSASERLEAREGTTVLVY